MKAMLGGAEQELVRDEVCCLLVRKRDVSVGREVPHCVVGLDLDALVSCFGVVKAVEYEGGAKLTVIEKVTRKFVVAIDPDIEAGQNSLDDPDVEIMRALGQHGTARAAVLPGTDHHTFVRPVSCCRMRQRSWGQLAPAAAA